MMQSLTIQTISRQKYFASHDLNAIRKGTLSLAWIHIAASIHCKVIDSTLNKTFPFQNPSVIRPIFFLLILPISHFKRLRLFLSAGVASAIG